MRWKPTLDQCRSVFDLLSHLLTRADARVLLDHVTLQYADGEEPSSAAVGRTPSDRYDSARDLEPELSTSLPVSAVGDPGQAEGDG
jgi:hypothetical protein